MRSIKKLWSLKDLKSIKRFWLFKILLFAAIDAYAQSPKEKAYYLFNFIKFVDWPASCQNEDFVVGVIGETAVYPELEQLLNGKRIYNQAVVVKKFTDPDMATRCHVIFVAESFCDQITCIINRFKSFNTLIVCERSGMVRRGSAISFLALNSKLGYEVNKQNIAKSGLHANSQLALLAANK
jgi:hypothetical protein